MRQFHNRKKGGFTLIELMIVVAIIGILAAIAIPNFIRFQLKSKSSEGKVNLAAIRTAEEGYMAEFGTYIAATVSPAAVPGTSKDEWEVQGGAPNFDTLGWSPEGNVYFQYGVATAADGSTYTASAAGDIDGTGANQFWGYVKNTGTTAVPNTIAGAHAACLVTGTWDATLATPASALFDTVGPCDGTSGASVF